MNELSDKDKPKKLEEIFREGMESAERPPSDQLWNRIEQELDFKETQFYKRQVSWYQMVAAACLTLLLSIGGYLIYDLKTNREIVTTAQQTKIPAVDLQKSQNEQITGNKHVGGRVVKEDQQLREGNLIKTAPLNNSESTGKINEDKTNQVFASGNLPLSPAERSIASGAGTIPQRNSQPSYGKGNVSRFGTNKNRQMLDSFNSELPVDKQSAKSVSGASGLADAGSASEIPDLALLTFEIPKIQNPMVLPETLNPVAQVLPVLTPAHNPTESEKINRWTIAGKYAPHYFNQNLTLTESKSHFSGTAFTSYSALSANAATPSSYAQALAEFDKNTEAQFSYSAGLQVAYQFNNQWDLETGLDYIQNMARTTTTYIFKNQVSPANRLIFTNSASANTSFAIPESISLPTTALVASITNRGDLANAQIIKTPAFETQYRYQLLGIPVKLNFKTKDKKSFYYASLGVLNSLLLQAHILTDSPKVPDITYAPKDSPFQNWQVAALASVGKGFRFGNGFSVQAGIEASQYVTSLAANSNHFPGDKRKPYTVGLGFRSGYTFMAK